MGASLHDYIRGPFHQGQISLFALHHYTHAFALGIKGQTADFRVLSPKGGLAWQSAPFCQAQQGNLGGIAEKLTAAVYLGPGAQGAHQIRVIERISPPRLQLQAACIT